MRKSVLVFSVAALASVLANVATLAPVNALDITSADGVTKTLTGTIDDGLYVKSDADITIKLDNATINAAAGKDTIYVEKGAKLTLTGKGVINNVAGRANVFSNGEVTIDGDITINHTGAYYAILNHGEMMTINKVTVNAGAGTNSVIVNGYYGFGSTDHRVGHVADVNYEKPQMTLGADVVVNIEGAVNTTIKNDDNGVMTIDGGIYAGSAAGVFQNANIATINGGEFVQANSDKPLIYNDHFDGGKNAGELNINGGRFIYAEDTFIEATDGSATTIKGGEFSFAPDEEFIAEGVEFEKNANGAWVAKAPVELPSEDNNEEKNPATADNILTFVATFAGALAALGATLVVAKKA